MVNTGGPAAHCCRLQVTPHGPPGVSGWSVDTAPCWGPAMAAGTWAGIQGGCGLVLGAVSKPDPSLSPESLG